jgi:hypothetical protein
MKTFTVKSITASFLLYAIILFANQAAFAQLNCQISGAPIVQTGALTAGDATQAGRINRNGITGSCPTGKTNAIFNASAVVQDNYTFTAPVTGCAQVDFDATACGGATTQMAAYSTFNPATPGSNVISDFGFSTTGTASFSVPVTMGQNYTLVVHDILETPTNLFCTSYTFRITYRTSCQQPGFDRANDGNADLAVFTPGALGFWSNTVATGGAVETRQFGQTGDTPTIGDYTGDSQTDLSVYRPSNNTWYYATNQANPPSMFVGIPWGVAGDKLVPGDYDADGKNDIAIWRPSNGHYYVLRSSTNTLQTRQWGRNGDTPVAADIDGDHITDFVIVRPDQAGESQLIWFMLQSNFNFGFGLFARWGSPGDIPVPADYDGNGKADIAVFRPTTGLWAALLSTTQNALSTSTVGVQWGTAGDIPQPADYDGDLKADQAIFRPSQNTWYIRNSATNTATITPFGTTGDVPASAPYPVTTVP